MLYNEIIEIRFGTRNIGLTFLYYICAFPHIDTIYDKTVCGYSVGIRCHFPYHSFALCIYIPAFRNYVYFCRLRTHSPKCIFHTTSVGSKTVYAIYANTRSTRNRFSNRKRRRITRAESTSVINFRRRNGSNSRTYRAERPREIYR
jgi:hypothetical protein